jgi:D-alanyl-D-alanine dipeptidase
MIRPLFFFVLLLPLSVAAQSGNDELVNVKELIPDIVLDLRYNTTNNFVTALSGKPQKLYTTDECYLARSTAERLIIVQDSLRKLGLGLKIYDGYRPRSVQYLMWEIYPNSTYVADPNSGSNHNRGAAVDVSLVNLSTGRELRMPTEFDFFGPEASHGYTTGLTQEQIDNRVFLRNMMMNVGGFTDYGAEWWHYQYPPATAYPLIDHQLK